MWEWGLVALVGATTPGSEEKGEGEEGEELGAGGKGEEEVGGSASPGVAVGSGQVAEEGGGGAGVVDSSTRRAEGGNSKVWESRTLGTYWNSRLCKNSTLRNSRPQGNQLLATSRWMCNLMVWRCSSRKSNPAATKNRC